ncbi:DegQ family serine endoprotease [Marinospirillum alkaliphilum]|uniref:Probable periplasmic serine endoprotease DegP-like n=1 Tax=Marinospirillum alkaliphilum DSM 21637 TaxID=1122209 RepID=A0A1K1YKA0_9GAMM|nr:DegQ family serine endoprotease [Marinospirillum alkaliphilum]SFX62312.1 serine protease Do [Marinospirillum alkaliphilum DSM 21637]
MLKQKSPFRGLLPVALSLACLSLISFSLQARSLPDFTELVEQAAPAVVNISTTQTAQRRSGPGIAPPADVPDIFRHFFGEMPEGFGQQPREQRRQSLGSGFIISEDGYILTNNHVVENADEVIVRLSDRRELVAELVGSDRSSDLALLKIDASGLPVVKIGNSDELKVGEWVLAIGSPFGFDHSVTAGIVSAKGRALPNETYVPFIQTDVAINPGNSGGPLFNLQGEVVGINSQIYTRSGGFMGLSFAIPMQVALEVAEQLREQGRVSRGWLGVVIQDVSRDLAESFGLDKPQGALIANVDPQGPGARGGIRAGDIILEVNGQTIERSSDLPPAVGRIQPGERGRFVVLRDGRQRTLNFAVGERPDDPQVVRSGRGSPEPAAADRLGLRVEAVPAALKERWSIENGVQVVEARSGSPAAQAGIRQGDVLVSIGGQDIRSPAQFAELVKKLPANQSIAVRLMRRGSPQFVALRIAE